MSQRLENSSPASHNHLRLKTAWAYRVGDLLAGTVIGSAATLACYLLIPENLGMFAGAVLGMVVGMGTQMLVSALLGILLGQMEMMVPGMFVGMLGMFVPMFHAQDAWTGTFAGGIIGFLVFALFTVWDASGQGSPLHVQPVNQPQKDIPPSGGRFEGPPWLYDALEAGGSLRHALFQKELFGKMKGRVLFIAAGSGLNFSRFPSGLEIAAIDLSPRMLETARTRAAKYRGSIHLREADAQQLPFGDESFETVATASTFCSVPDPVRGLSELFRVLKPGGKLLMFEHVRSRNALVGVELDLLSLFTRWIGPAMNRDTVAYAQRPGFIVDRVQRAYLDVFLAIEAHKPLPATAGVPERSSLCRN